MSSKGKKQSNSHPGPRAIEKKRVPVRVMLPLDTFVKDEETGRPVLKDANWLKKLLMALSKAGVNGVSVDVWWGLFAIDGIQYDFGCVVQLAEMCLKFRLHLTCIMSFHVCGNSVGDSVHVPMPAFVVDSVKSLGEGSGFYCADCHGREATDAFSPAADELPLKLDFNPLPTTLLSLYSTFMELFAAALREEPNLMGYNGVVDEVAIGMGPCGELRYPSYDETLGWKWPEPGSLMCFDPHMRELAEKRGVVLPTVEEASVIEGTAEDGRIPLPPLFSDKKLFNTAENKKFLQFYCDILAEHAERMLESARIRAFRPEHKVRLSVKFSGVHWMHQLKTRPAEVCAGYYNYDRLLQAITKYGAGATFTCYDMDTEMLASENPLALSDPNGLVTEFASSAHRAGVAFLAAENSLECWDTVHFDKMHQNVIDTNVECFTFLRITPETFPFRQPKKRYMRDVVVGLIAIITWTVAIFLFTEGTDEELSTDKTITLVVFFVLASIVFDRAVDRGGINENFLKFVKDLN